MTTKPLLESCCFNEPRDYCLEEGCECGCHATERKDLISRLDILRNKLDADKRSTLKIMSDMAGVAMGYSLIADNRIKTLEGHLLKIKQNVGNKEVILSIISEALGEALGE